MTMESCRLRSPDISILGFLFFTPSKGRDLSLHSPLTKGCRCLEGLRLEIFPSVAHRGGEVRMTCIYDLGDSPLCYVKWYRGNFEFYRYTPSENPPHKLFPYPGIHVNVGLSNGTQVVLDGLGLGLSGKVTCEVTTDDAIPQSASLESTLVVHGSRAHEITFQSFQTNLLIREQVLN
ncbi:hypothetical protein GE061_011389 [Apolygus lucorum]|uniref:Ig-like domain-containing protein n=1 Tax=Apolygus lucorum TaxID=248454 RepID=A0A8S9XXP3_APOLU|nr:hypothetical protein GE061_011389 [Apolygus lucorum]